ncbi:OLC1v1036151C3 [Oldenlandia corymbosa var. corymbosa]|uniref:Flavin-containing monooxygenase n=1 Tax=Oldenlandia corymbosa var. corymbosa TaxID=529605 RepID=A0AAV1CWK2_OLDCO|nr:OLC1v1036151C3 [Oldenlandia corymbosa var. corymbosa]
MKRAVKVAVIGAGLAGLVTARELKREGHEVVIYEKSDRVGGLWVYDPQVEDDPLSLDPNRKIVHSSLFRSVLATFPREIMGFSDYPFFPVDDENHGTTIHAEFPPHEEVLHFLNHFAKDFELIQLIRFNTQVTRVALSNDDEKCSWVVESVSENVGSASELFQAVTVCSGHFTLPRLAELPGIDQWPGKQIHSHNYREPSSFRDQIVIVVGGAMSACDISQDISQVAKEVHVSSRSAGLSKKLEGCPNLWQHPEVNQFLMMELQAKWIARVLSGKTILPSKEDMTTDVEKYYQEMEEMGIPKHFTHRLTSANQFEYLDWIAAQAGLSVVDDKTKKITKDVWNILHLYHGSWVKFRQKYIKMKTKPHCCNNNENA